MPKVNNVKKMLANAAYRERNDQAKQKATKAKWEHWVGEYPVMPELKHFIQDLQPFMPRAQFFPTAYTSQRVEDIVDSDTGYVTDYIRIDLVEEFCVIMPDQPYDIGKVNYKDNGVKQDDRTYGVYSRKITNEKYRDHRDQHHMVLASDRVKAVKNACKYITPFTSIELAHAAYRDIHSKIYAAYAETQSNFKDIAITVSGKHNEILEEIRHLKSLGVTFKTELFRTAADKIDDAWNVAHEEERRVTDCAFVRFKEVGTDVYAEVQMADDVRRNNHMRMNGVPTSYLMNDLPEHLAHKIAALNILDDKQYVNKIGQKIDDKSFWVEV